MAKNKIQSMQTSPSFVTMEDPGKALAAYGDAIQDNEGIGHSTAGAVGRTFLDWDTNVSIRSSYHRGDYEHFRDNETVPTKSDDIIKICNKAYQNIGIIKHVIDLMAEFASKGVRLQHPDKKTEKFYNTWFKKVEGKNRSERFLNLFYRIGNVVTKRSIGTITSKDAIKWQQAKGKKGDEVELEKTSVKKRQIPLKYSFLNPTSLEVIGGELAAFVGEYNFALKINTSITTSTRSGYPLRSSRQSENLLNKLSPDIRKAIKQGAKTVELDNSKIQHFHYKKDDWQVWAYPMIYSILQDLIMYEKMKLADVSALDGAISNVRLWRLGFINESNVAQSILPTKTGINKLRNILANNVGGGTLDLVWGPELDFKESASEVWRWLGSEKYVPILNAIYDGIGIPSALRAGLSKDNAGNVIGLQTLIERLEYGRCALVEFWENEIDITHRAMGFKSVKPTIMFDQMILADRAAEKQLLINLWDRDIISMESILESFSKTSDVEKSRVKRESEVRGNKMPYKASPFHNPDPEHDYKKILLQGGSVAPSEIGFDLDPKKSKEKNRLDYIADTQIKVNKTKPVAKFDPTGTVQDGRPKNVTETKKRKPKPDVAPAKGDFTNLFLWANETQGHINKIVMPGLLSHFNKDSIRKLSREEFDICEDIKLRVLCNISPYTEINKKVIGEILDNSPRLNSEIVGMSKLFKHQFSLINDREPKLDELRQILCSAYSFFFNEDDI